MLAGRGEATLDLDGIHALTPSFLDEALTILEESVGPSATSRLRVILCNTPTGISSKFVAVARAHGLSATESENGAWVLEQAH